MDSGFRAAISHVERIRRCVDRPETSSEPGRVEQGPGALVEASWRRCIIDYGLDPLGLGELDVLPEAAMRHHAAAVEELLPFARRVITTLSARLVDEAHTILLADAESVILHRLGDLGLAEGRARTEIEPGAVWDERRQGTNGIGTSIATGETASIFLSEHFAPRNSWLSCTSTPVRTPTGEILGALNVTLLGCRYTRRRAAVEHLLETAARRVEDMLLLSRLQKCWILGLTASAEFAGVSSEALLAIDDDGLIAGANGAARAMITAVGTASPIGRRLDEVLGVSFEGLLRSRSDAGVAAVRIGSSVMYATARAPVRPLDRKPAATAATPARPTRRQGDLSLEDVAGGDPLLQREIGRLRRFIDRKIPIIIGGETGTGKEALAKAVHRASARAAKPFVAVNCAAIPGTLIESELFGYAEGAFTGASRRGFRGKVIQASGGTLFLDEIGDMPLEAQTRLLRVIAEGEVCPLGSDRLVPVDLQVVCASHQDLEALVEKGGFRADLLYRLSGATVVMPALRNRADKADLIERVLDGEAAELGIDARLSPDAAAALARYGWPGNIRQLRLVLRAAIVASTGGLVTGAELPPAIARSGTGATGEERPADAAPGRFAEASSPEADALLHALRENAWRIADTARALGLSRQAVYRKMDRFRIVSPNRADAGNVPP